MERDTVFSSILNESQSLIRAYIAGMGVPFDQVDDLAQDVFIHYYKEFEKKPNEVEHIPWLKGIAKNYSLRYFERMKKEKQDKAKLLKVIQLVQDVDLDIDLKTSQKIVDQLKECLKELSESNQNMMKYRFEDGKSYEELGKMFNMSSQAIGMTLMRIKIGLQKCVNKGMRYDS